MDPELQKRFDELAARVASLESELADLKRLKSDEISEDTILAISAAVAAYLGVKAKIKQVHFSSGRGWTQEGRGAVHRRTVPHVR